MSIYTKNGDKGLTSTLSGTRKSKADELICALGNVDELNSILGLLLVYLKEDNAKVEFRNKIQGQQMNLMKLGSMLAISDNEALVDKYPKLISEDVKALEADIDLWVADLPELKNFILPGGSKMSAYAHHARSVCRRVERSIVDYHEDHAQEEVVLQYLNRLSDWLFVFARVLNEGKDIIWEGNN